VLAFPSLARFRFRLRVRQGTHTATNDNSKYMTRISRRSSVDQDSPLLSSRFSLSQTAFCHPSLSLDDLDSAGPLFSNRFYLFMHLAPFAMLSGSSFYLLPGSYALGSKPKFGSLALTIYTRVTARRTELLLFPPLLSNTIFKITQTLRRPGRACSSMSTSMPTDHLNKPQPHRTRIQFGFGFRHLFLSSCYWVQNLYIPTVLS